MATMMTRDHSTLPPLPPAVQQLRSYQAETEPQWKLVRALPGSHITRADVVAYRSAVVHSKTRTELEYLTDALLVVDHSQSGLILDLINVAGKSLEEVDELAAQACAHEVIEFKGRIIMPGFIDTHAHAPQYAFTGTGMNLPLLKWLETYTFPCEAKFAELDFAREVYSKSVRRHLMNGTTTCSYFATLHLEASKLLVDIVREQGQRAYVGKVSMDRNSPDFYVEETQAGIAAAHAFVKYALQTEQSGKATTGASTVVNKMKRVASESRFVIPRKESLGALTDLESPETSDPEESDAQQQAQQQQANGSNGNGSNGNGAAAASDGNGSGSGNGRPIPAPAGGGGGGVGGNPSSSSLDGSGHGSGAPRARGRSGSFGQSPRTSSSTNLASPGAGAGGSFSAYGSSPRLGSSPQLEKRMRAMSLGQGGPPTLAAAPPLVTPVVTPRFVPSCTREMLQALGDLSRQLALPVQSHLSESQGEVAWVRELHPECESYTDVYRRYGLLHERAYFAHCCHCGGDEQELLKVTNAGVAHCPSSNFMLGSGVLNVRRLIQKGVKVGLGTDVAGGYSTSILDAARQAIIASRCVSFTEKDEEGRPYEALSLDEVFYLATQGGAEVLGLGAQVGNFEPGKYFDALIVDPNTDDSPLDIFENELLHNAFEKYMFLGDDRSISAIFVGGRRVL